MQHCLHELISLYFTFSFSTFRSLVLYPKLKQRLIALLAIQSLQDYRSESVLLHPGLHDPAIAH